MPKNVSQSKDAEKLPTDTNFQAPASTGCKVEIAGTNTAVGKGEIARKKQFFLFPQCLLPCYKTFCHFHQI